MGSRDGVLPCALRSGNLTCAFLKLCKNRGLKLNTEKIRLRQKGVSFIGHVVTDTGLRVAPAKVKAIVEMPASTDKTGVERLLGLAQYLSKFPSSSLRPHQTPYTN